MAHDRFRHCLYTLTGHRTPGRYQEVSSRFGSLSDAGHEALRLCQGLGLGLLQEDRVIPIYGGGKTRKGEIHFSRL